MEPWRRGASGFGADAVRPVMVEPEPVESGLKQAGAQVFRGIPEGRLVARSGYVREVKGD